jgi:CRP-like cAMP-binding protein
MTSVVSAGSCSFSLVCLEPVSLICLPFEAVQRQGRNDLEFANALIELLILLSMKKEKREYELLCLSAEERFNRLLKTSPALLEKVTQNDLARYLGITPVGLSRIKKRVQSKGR